MLFSMPLHRHSDGIWRTYPEHMPDLDVLIPMLLIAFVATSLILFFQVKRTIRKQKVLTRAVLDRVNQTCGMDLEQADDPLGIRFRKRVIHLEPCRKDCDFEDHVEKCAQEVVEKIARWKGE